MVAHDLAGLGHVAQRGHRLALGGAWVWYVAVEEIQRDLDRFLTHYNISRSHQGYRLNGRTPAQALREALGLDDLSPLDFTIPQP